MLDFVKVQDAKRYLGELTFDKARYEKSILINAQSETMDQRDDFQDGEINDPIRPPEDLPSFEPSAQNAQFEIEFLELIFSSLVSGYKDIG